MVVMDPDWSSQIPPEEIKVKMPKLSRVLIQLGSGLGICILNAS